MSKDNYLKMLEKLADNLTLALESDEFSTLSEDEMLSLLNGLEIFNQCVDTIVGINEDDFDLEQAESLLSEMDSFLSGNDAAGDSILKRFDNLGKSLQMGALDKNQYKN